MDVSPVYISEATYLCLLPTGLLFLWTLCRLLLAASPKTPKALSWEGEGLKEKSSHSIPYLVLKFYGIPYVHFSIPWKLLILGLSFLYTLMTSATEVCKGSFFSGLEGTSFLPLLRLALLLLCTLSCCLLFYRLLAGLPAGRGRFHHIGSTPFYWVWIPILAFTLLFVAGAFPGFLSSDTAGSWYAVMTGTYSDWHTLPYLYLLKIVQILFGNPYPLVILQGLLWLLAHHYALLLLERYAPTPWMEGAYLGGSFLLFGCYRALCNVEKDTLWNIAFFLFCLGILEVIREKRLPRHRLVLLFFSGITVALIRHMGNWIVLFTLAALFLYLRSRKRRQACRKKRRLLLSLAAAVAAAKILLVYVVGFGLLGAYANPPYTAFSIPMSMLGAVASKEEIPPREAAVMEQILPLKEWADYYDKYYADTLGRDWGPIGDRINRLGDPEIALDVLLLNAKFLVRYPATYLTAYLDMTSILWEMGTPADGYEWIPISLYSANVDTYPELVGQGLQMQYTPLTTAIEKASALSEEIPVFGSITWRGGFSLFLLLLSLLLLLRKGLTGETLFLLPCLWLAGVLFLANPSQDPRYIGGWQMMALFAFLLALGQRLETLADRSPHS